VLKHQTIHIAYNADGEIIGVIGLSFDALVELHCWIGNQAGCSDDSCPCYAAGEQAQREWRP